MVKCVTMITFKNVTKTFGDVVALKNVSFEVKKGEFLFITGASGSGKTTILRLILGETLPDSGEILFGSTNVAEVSPSELPLLRQRIGCVFQDYKLLSEKTVQENVEIALAVLGIPEEEWQEKVDKVLKVVGLTNRKDFFPAQLSGGELQRVSLARALVVNPELILADEPTGNLDWDTADQIMNLLERVNKEGKTVIVAIHNREIVAKMKKRIYELSS